MLIKTHMKIIILVFYTRFIIHYITRVQLQNGLTFVVVNWGYKQRTLNTHNQCGINIPIFFYSKK